MSSKDPTDARAAFLKTLPPEEQVQVLLRAEKVGPYSSDPDWLVAYAMSRAVEQIKDMVAEVDASIKSGVGKSHGCQPKPTTNSTRLVLWSVATSLALFVGIVEFVLRFSSAHLQEVAVYSAALAIGVSGSALYASLAPYFVRKSTRK